MSGGNNGGLESYLPMALAIGATVATGGAAAPAIGTMLGAEAGTLGAAALGAGAMGAGTSALGGIMQGKSAGDILKDSLISGTVGAGTAGIMGGLSGGAGAQYVGEMPVDAMGTMPSAPVVSGIDQQIANEATLGQNIQTPQEIVDNMKPTIYAGGPQNLDTTAYKPPTGLESTKSFLDKAYTPTTNMEKYAPGIASAVAGSNIFAQPNIGLPQQPGQGVPDALKFKFDRNTYQPAVAPYYGGIATNYPQGPAAQRLQGYADGGTVEQMSRENAIGGNQSFPQSSIGGLTGANTYQNATNTPMGTNVLEPTDAITDPYTGAMKFADGGNIRETLGGPLYDPAMDEYKRETDFLDRMRNNNLVNPFHLATGGVTPTSSTQGTQQNSSLNIPMVKEYLAALNTVAGQRQVNSLAQQGDYNAQFALNHAQNGAVQGMDSESQMPTQNAAQGGIMGYKRGGDLGSYSDGGRMLKGPGDGMSDSIPAKIGEHQPARLADSEFVVPADVVSHLGNGSSDAGAKQLYKMMDNVRKARTGRKAQGKQISPEKYLPA